MERKDLMSKIYLIRHGQTDWNLEGRIQGSRDIPLNDTGRRQAASLAEGMKDRRLELVLSSPLCRARETARVLAESQGVPLLCWRELEEVRYGSWEGMTVAEIQEQFPEEYRRWWGEAGEGRPPGGESRMEAFQRGAFLAEKIRRQVRSHKLKGVAVVSHGAMLCCMLPALLKGQAPFEEGFSVQNGGITTLYMDPESGMCSLEAVNDCSHFSGENL